MPTADVTLVAAAGSDATAGLPGALSGSRQVVQPAERVHQVTLLLEAAPLSVVLAASCWRTRAWTFQEEHLSTRLLVFTDKHGRRRRTGLLPPRVGPDNQRHLASPSKPVLE